MTKVGFVAASLFVTIDAYAATDTKVITLHMRVVAETSLEEYEEDSGRGAIELRDPGPPGLAAPQGTAMDMSVRATAVEDTTYHEVLPFTP